MLHLLKFCSIFKCWGLCWKNKGAGGGSPWGVLTPTSSTPVNTQGKDIKMVKFYPPACSFEQQTAELTTPQPFIKTEVVGERRVAARLSSRRNISHYEELHQSQDAPPQSVWRRGIADPSFLQLFDSITNSAPKSACRHKCFCIYVHCL